ncbi:rhodanese-like domain-containing protein [Spirochaeta cellobiosiphila]|uniref:rhodanese-like domain-containing protein n=1 Tax=Spirochaeta cellobiosiphila TaxID=504483 RepID=UPI00040D8A76|nr:rhodanese-like domain-containing protein [Spirochaeta cellobiosiphila]
MQKIIFIIVIVLVIAIAFPIFAAPKADPAKYEWLKNQIETNKKLIILDVRTKEEYNRGHIPGAKLYPVDQLRNNYPKASKDQQLVVYCRSGNRSALAKRTLESLGYTNVYDFGGLYNWQDPLEK